MRSPTEILFRAAHLFPPAGHAALGLIGWVVKGSDQPAQALDRRRRLRCTTLLRRIALCLETDDFTRLEPVLVEYERVFGANPDAIARLAGLWVDHAAAARIVTSDWVRALTPVSRVEITALLRRLHAHAPVRAQLDRNASARQATRILRVLDQDTLAHYTASAREAASLNAKPPVRKPVGRLMANTALAARNSVAVTSGLIYAPLAGPLEHLLGFLRPAGAWLARRRIQSASVFSRPALVRNLARYERRYAYSTPAVSRLANLLANRGLLSTLVKSRAFLEAPLPVLVDTSSLLRRIRDANDTAAAELATAQEARLIDIPSQADLAALTKAASPAPALAVLTPPKPAPERKALAAPPAIKKLSASQMSAEQREEAELARMLEEAEAQISRVLTRADAGASSKPRTARAPKSSKRALRTQGWVGARSAPARAFERRVLSGDAGQAVAAVLDTLEHGGAIEESLAERVSIIAALQSDSGDALRQLQSCFENNLTIEELAKLSNDEVALKARARALLFDGPQPDTRQAWADIESALDAPHGAAQGAALFARAYADRELELLSLDELRHDAFGCSRLAELSAVLVQAESAMKSPRVRLAAACLGVLAGRIEHTRMWMDGIDRSDTDAATIIAEANRALRDNALISIDSLTSSDAEDTYKTLDAVDPESRTLVLVEQNASTRQLRRLEGLSPNMVCLPVPATDRQRYPAEITVKQFSDVIRMYSTDDMELGQQADWLTRWAIGEMQDMFAAAPATAPWSEYIETLSAGLFLIIYNEVCNFEALDRALSEAGEYDRVIFLMNDGALLSNYLKPAAETVGGENVFVSLAEASAPDALVGLCARALGGEDVGRYTPPVVRARPELWRGGFDRWMASVNATNRARFTPLKRPYALALFQHINGYFDSYVSVCKETLKHSDVQLLTSNANTALNGFVEEGGFFEDGQINRLKQIRFSRAPGVTASWAPDFAAALAACLDRRIDSRWRDQGRALISRIIGAVNTRLPVILEMASHFKNQFEIAPPTHLLTGPNQHLEARTASHAAKAAGIPVFDFLILAFTDHPRYRAPRADWVFMYDPWYKQMYVDYCGLRPGQLEVSGPLFDYQERLQRPVNDALRATLGASDDARLVTIFTQNANLAVSTRLVTQIAEMAQDQADIHIAVKLHPHESPQNMPVYRTILDEAGLADRSIVFKGEDAVEMINLSSLVVQCYSNIGLDAHLMGKPVISARFGGEVAARIMLREKRIGWEVHSDEELLEAARALMTDAAARERLAGEAEAFAQENEGYLRKDNAERTIARINELREVFARGGHDAPAAAE
ncbi:MAG: hypothetical protein AAFX09_12170 [Pseudomonadota bacterium]